ERDLPQRRVDHTKPANEQTALRIEIQPFPSSGLDDESFAATYLLRAPRLHSVKMPQEPQALVKLCFALKLHQLLAGGLVHCTLARVLLPTYSAVVAALRLAIGKLADHQRLVRRFLDDLHRNPHSARLHDALPHPS